MSVWLVGLTLGAGYLMNKKITMMQNVEEKVHEFNSGVGAAVPGPATATIRQVQRTLPQSDVQQGINEKAPVARQKYIKAAQEAEHQAVGAYESASQLPEIQGVYLTFG